jgi:ABC-2 type transport system ATP-binding protein
MKNKLEIQNLKKNFRKKSVLNGINCSLDSGVYAILGPNGAGKTTLMRCIAGLYSYHGDILLAGKNTRKSAIQIGYLPQEFNLFPELTVYQMMEYFCNLKGIPKRKRKETIEDCLKKVNLLEQINISNRKLSGGMIRRVGIAQAILGEPDIILLDEPTAGLDPEERMRFKNIINNLCNDNIILISTHIVEDVEACCDHIIVMKQGRIIQNGKIQEIQDYAQGRIQEIGENELTLKDILYVEKSYLKDGKKIYRVIMQTKTDDSIPVTVEDGYLCMLKEN